MNIPSREKGLSGKELLFCRYFIKELDPQQAAIRAGYKKASAEKIALKLLKNNEIRREIENLKREKIRTSRDNIQSGYERLAYGRVSDCIKLLFFADVDFEDFSDMDFFNIAEIKKLKDGGMEIKFFDRFKALEMLNKLSEKEISETPAIYKALLSGADALDKNNA